MGDMAESSPEIARLIERAVDHFTADKWKSMSAEKIYNLIQASPYARTKAFALGGAFWMARLRKDCPDAPMSELASIQDRPDFDLAAFRVWEKCVGQRFRPTALDMVALKNAVVARDEAGVVATLHGAEAWLRVHGESIERQFVTLIIDTARAAAWPFFHLLMHATLHFVIKNHVHKIVGVLNDIYIALPANTPASEQAYVHLATVVDQLPNTTNTRVTRKLAELSDTGNPRTTLPFAAYYIKVHLASQRANTRAHIFANPGEISAHEVAPQQQQLAPLRF